MSRLSAPSRPVLGLLLVVAVVAAVALALAASAQPKPSNGTGQAPVGAAPLGAAAPRAGVAPSPTASPPPLPSPSAIPEAPVVKAEPAPSVPPADAEAAKPVEAAKTQAPARPTPSPDPATWRVEGVVLEVEAKQPIADVCMAIGPHGCQRGSVRTDSRGVFYIDVPQNPNVIYDLYFLKDGFAPVWVRIKPEGPSVYNVALARH